MASLVEVGTERAYALQDRTSIGRDRGCDICVDDPMVSTNHAEIVRDASGAYRLRDLGSRRGTYVGSRKVDEVELHDGDELLIGPVRMRFFGSAAAGTRPPPIAIARTKTGEVDELTRLRAVVELSRAIGAEHDLRKVLERVLDTCFQVLAAERGAIAVYLPQSKSPHITVARMRNGEDALFALSTTVLSNVMTNHSPYMSAEVDSDAALRRSASLSVHGVRSLIAVPLLYRAAETEWLGVIQLDSSLATHAFDQRDLDLLAAIGGQAGLGIKNAILVRQLQTAIDQEWGHLERVVRDLPTGVVMLDGERRCVIANDWVTAHAGLVGTIERGAVIDRIAELDCEKLEGTNQRLQVSVRGRILEIITKASLDDRETVIVMSDVTDERERQTQQAHRDRLSLIGQLAGGIAHDFNNLLSVMLTYSSMLEESLEDPNAREDVRMIGRAATSASELTRQLLMFSRREIVTPRVVDVAALVQGMDRLLRRTIGSRIVLVTEIADELPHVLIDNAQLEQVVLNLVVNARDAIAAAGRISLRVSSCLLEEHAVGRLPAGRYVSIEVEDDGSGMSAETLAHIFEPYFTTKGLNKGTGLGLATVHAIVSQARGEILVRSKVDEGTTFRVYLPKTDRPIDVERISAGTPVVTSTILLVDDDDDVRRMVERVLRRAGYSVLVASSGTDALTRARAHGGSIDLLLTDMVMPGMSGQELARDLVRERPSVRVVFMSGYHQGAPIEPRKFVVKPFDREVLLGKVADALAAEEE